MKEMIRDRILNGALELLQSPHEQDFTMERLAEWIGVSRKTIYNHFASRDDVISEAIAAGLNRIVRDLTIIAEDSSAGFVDRLDRIIEQGFRDTRRLTGPATRSPRDISSAVQEVNNHLHRLIQRIVAEAAETGLLSESVNPDVFGHVILNMIRGLRLIDDPDNLPCTPLELLRESLRFSITGVVSPRGAVTLQGSHILAMAGAPR